MINEFKLTGFHLRAQTRCKSEHARGFTARKQNCVGLRASGPPGRRAVAGRGPRAAGSSGRRAAGPWRAAGRWAAGLLLAKPHQNQYLREKYARWRL